jgi:alpha-glucosidase
MRQAIEDSVGVVARSGAALTWTLNNHDAQRNVTRYGRADATDPASWTGNNLVNSDAPVDLVIGERRARAAALVVLALPGAAYLYQGEELGLPEVLDIPADRREDPLFWRTGGAEIGRDGCRVPLPWTRDPLTNFGFSGTSGAPGAPGAPAWLPQPSGWERWSVVEEEADPDSMLHLYRRAVAHRRGSPGLRSETFAWVDLPGDVVAFQRGEVLIMVNVGGTPVRVPDELCDGRKVLVSSVPGHEDVSVVPADAAVWLAVP